MSMSEDARELLETLAGLRSKLRKGKLVYQPENDLGAQITLAYDSGGSPDGKLTVFSMWYFKEDVLACQNHARDLLDAVTGDTLGLSKRDTADLKSMEEQTLQDASHYLKRMQQHLRWAEDLCNDPSDYGVKGFTYAHARAEGKKLFLEWHLKNEFPDRHKDLVPLYLGLLDAVEKEKYEKAQKIKQEIRTLPLRIR